MSTNSPKKKLIFTVTITFQPNTLSHCKLSEVMVNRSPSPTITTVKQLVLPWLGAAFLSGRGAFQEVKQLVLPA